MDFLVVWRALIKCIQSIQKYCQNLEEALTLIQYQLHITAKQIPFRCLDKYLRQLKYIQDYDIHVIMLGLSRLIKGK